MRDAAWVAGTIAPLRKRLSRWTALSLFVVVVICAVSAGLFRLAAPVLGSLFSMERAPGEDQVRRDFPEFITQAAGVEGLYYNMDTNDVIFRYTLSGEPATPGEAVLLAIKEAAVTKGWALVEETSSSLRFFRVGSGRLVSSALEVRVVLIPERSRVYVVYADREAFGRPKRFEDAHGAPRAKSHLSEKLDAYLAQERAGK